MAENAERCGVLQTSHMRDMGKFPEPRGIWTCQRLGYPKPGFTFET
jgi:hypothetical protein